MDLLLLPLLPLLAVLCLPLFPLTSTWVRPAALAAGLLQFGWALRLLAHPPAPIALSWLPRLGLRLELGLDGISLPLVLLARIRKNAKVQLPLVQLPLVLLVLLLLLLLLMVPLLVPLLPLVLPRSSVPGPTLR
jgi:NADH:ubiquinone oxidoreductase subunit 4 (subunit M)